MKFDHTQSVLEKIDSLSLLIKCLEIAFNSNSFQLGDPNLEKIQKMISDEKYKMLKLETDLRIAKLSNCRIHVYWDGDDHVCIEFCDNSKKSTQFIYGENCMNKALVIAESWAYNQKEIA